MFSAPKLALHPNSPPSPTVCLTDIPPQTRAYNILSHVKEAAVKPGDDRFNFSSLNGFPSPGKFFWEDTPEAFCSLVTLLYYEPSSVFLTQLFNKEGEYPFMFDVDIKQNYGYNHDFIAVTQKQLSPKCVFWFLLQELCRIMRATEMPQEAVKCVVWSAHGRVDKVYKTSYRVIFYNLFLKEGMALNLYEELVSLVEEKSTFFPLFFTPREDLDPNIYKGSGTRVPFSDKPPYRKRCEVCSGVSSSKPLRPAGKCPYGKGRKECGDVLQKRNFVPFMNVDPDVDGYIDTSPVSFNNFILRSSARPLAGRASCPLSNLFKQKYQQETDHKQRALKRRKCASRNSSFKATSTLPKGFMASVFGPSVSFGSVRVSNDKTFFWTHTVPTTARCPFKGGYHKRSRLKVEVKRNGEVSIICFMSKCRAMDSSKGRKVVQLSKQELDSCHKLFL